MHRIALLIPVFNRLDHTRECLTILENNKESAFFKKNIVFRIVIDDASSDGTAAFIESNYADVIVLKGTGNLWWSGGMNMGIQYALDKLNCDFILTWENDITPETNYFDNLQEIIVNWQPGTIVCSKIKIKQQPDYVCAMGGVFNTKTGFKELIGAGKTDGPDFSKVIEADWFCGQGILIHKSVFKTIGLMDEVNFPQYHGDSDFALRAKKAAFRNLIFPELVIWNDTSTTGISHAKNKSIKQLWQSLVKLGSNYNIDRDIRFYRRHATNLIAYRYLIDKYFRYIGGYFKWKALGYFIVSKPQKTP